jgi:enamine deaminase RidA (YjgF/YER057c/UK114 family)
MWSSGLTLDRSRLSRRTFLGGATGAAGTGALLSARAAHGAPAPLPAPGARWLLSEDPAFAVGASVGDLTFVAQDAAGPGELPSGAVPQAERTLENIRRALAAVGQSVDDLVFLEVLLTDYAAAPEIGRLLRTAFRPDRGPTTCFVGVSALGPDRMVRMDAVASTNRDRAQVVVEGVRSRWEPPAMPSGWASLSLSVAWMRPKTSARRARSCSSAWTRYCARPVWV